MALRLYRTTRRLFRQVEAALQVVHMPAAVAGHRTTSGLIALYVTGLLLLEAHPTQAPPRRALVRCCRPAATMRSIASCGRCRCPRGR